MSKSPVISVSFLSSRTFVTTRFLVHNPLKTDFTVSGKLPLYFIKHQLFFVREHNRRELGSERRFIIAILNSRMAVFPMISPHASDPLPGKLDDNLIVSLPVNDRLGNAELVNPVSDASRT